MSSLSQTITYGTRVITYTVNYSTRKTLEISVNPDTSVVIEAPHNAELATIQARVQHRARWIVKQQQYFSQFKPHTPERLFIGGETHLYLGRQYRLKILAANDPVVKLRSGRIQIHTPAPDNTDTTRKLLQQWYRDRAILKLPERLEACYEPFRRRGYPKPQLQIRSFQTTLGQLNGTR